MPTGSLFFCDSLNDGPVAVRNQSALKRKYKCRQRRNHQRKNRNSLRSLSSVGFRQRSPATFLPRPRINSSKAAVSWIAAFASGRSLYNEKTLSHFPLTRVTVFRPELVELSRSLTSHRLAKRSRIHHSQLHGCLPETASSANGIVQCGSKRFSNSDRTLIMHLNAERGEPSIGHILRDQFQLWFQGPSSVARSRSELHLYLHHRILGFAL